MIAMWCIIVVNNITHAVVIPAHAMESILAAHTSPLWNWSQQSEVGFSYDVLPLRIPPYAFTNFGATGSLGPVHSVPFQTQWLVNGRGDVE